MEKRRWRIIDEELKEDVCLLVLAGVPARLVGEALGASVSTVLRTVRKRFRDRPRFSRVSTRDLADIRRRVAQGETVKALAAEYDIHRTLLSRRLGSVWKMRRADEGVQRSELRLSLREREEISRGVEAGLSASAIARSLNRAASTVTRELKRCGGRRAYRAWRGEVRFVQKARRPKSAKLASNDALRAKVEEGLANFWSPEQISRRLRLEFEGEPLMHVSHETIYQSLYVQGRGALRAELKRHLRWKRMQRKTRAASREDRRGQIPDMVMISARPPEVEARAVVGDWEGDLIIGRGGKSAIATLVERKSRFVMLAALPNGRSAAEVRDALAQLVKRLPAELRRTLTWDQGKEMAQHAAFTISSGVEVYFCDPHSPWQRGSNENTNGLLRQFLPRTADLGEKTQPELDHIAALLNNRPRQTLDWMKPSEVFNRAVAMTA